MTNPAFVLSIDTALQGCSAALLGESSQCFSKTERMMRGQSERLVPMIQELMAEAGISGAHLFLIAVTIGPGAFTGLRIGLSTARALAICLSIPVAGVTTFEPIARAYVNNAEREKMARRFAVILETKRDDFYAQIFGPEGVAENGPMACDADFLADRLYPGDEAIGDGAERFFEMRPDRLFLKTSENERWLLPDPSLIAEIGCEQFSKGEMIAPEPLYLRDADVSKSKTMLRSIAEYQS